MSDAQALLPEHGRANGMVIERVDETGARITLDYERDRHGGAPGLFHGGQIGALLEAAMSAAVNAGAASTNAARTVSLTVQYLRAAGRARLFAEARIVRRGRQLAYVEARAFQDDPEKPVAMATANYAFGS